MNKYLSIIKSNIIGISICLGIFYWGLTNDGPVKIIISLFILYTIIKSGISNFNYAFELNNWIETNQGSLILFYPTKKVIQERIKSDFIPKIPYNIKEVYYDGPKLVGDLKRSVIFEIMKWNSNITIHEPSILKINGKDVIVESLVELKSILEHDLNYEELLERIEKVEKSA